MGKENKLRKRITLSIISGLGAITSAGLLVMLVLMSENKFQLIYSSIYCAILIIYFIIMMLYNALKNEKTKTVFYRISESMKFMILASMSLLLFITLNGLTLGWISFGIVWVLIIIGAVLEYFKK